jgi:hypothetical protein
LRPVAHVQLGRAWRADGVTGYDLTFSAPKSVSALWALGDDTVVTAIRKAHATAVRTALDYLDDHASHSRTGRDGHTQVGTDGFAAAVFDHRTSRAGDPQLHTHALVRTILGTADDNAAAHTRLPQRPEDHAPGWERQPTRDELLARAIAAAGHPGREPYRNVAQWDPGPDRGYGRELGR